jgi:hypothetical protein
MHWDSLKSRMFWAKGKGKVLPITGREDPEEMYRYNYTLSLTSALEGVGGQRHAPAALPTRKTRYPFYRRLGGPQGRSEHTHTHTHTYIYIYIYIYTISQQIHHSDSLLISYNSYTLRRM